MGTITKSFSKMLTFLVQRRTRSYLFSAGLKLTLSSTGWSLVFDLGGRVVNLNDIMKFLFCLENPKAELPQEGFFFRTQFPSLGIFINKKSWKSKKLRPPEGQLISE